VLFVAKRYASFKKVSEETNGNLPATNTPVQLLALYTDPEPQYTSSQTDGQTDE